LYFDQGAAQEWAQLYAEDGEFIGSGQRINGRETLEAFLAGVPASTTHRVTVNHVIDIDGDRALCRSSVLLLDNGVIVSSGRTVDKFAHIDGVWRIARRSFDADPTRPEGSR